MNSIEKLDTDLFLNLNGFHSSFFDEVMYYISGTLTWIPLYAFVLFLIFRKYKLKGLYILGLLVIGVFLSDQLSVHAFKEVFQRYRPCHNLDLEGLVHTVNGKCGGKFGFVSSHAANTFMFAMLTSLFIRHKTFIILIFFWAALVSYSRIYLGVHYPGDVVAGGMLGASISLILYFCYLKIKKKACKNSID